ncbi:DUF1992 domain-containing protein [Paenibacillus sambharensis]|uniref:DUF1992 domain-containing protein n=1 Tax=Paenibacillus sambharensis TaxID=1803190 RepID=A0A2W1LNZ3_9BACL|nr:DnaJ family domain-containing protein [Paenibacillus sambharensis]PZD96234.1 DUF1992 domain-containing protein [Paenibacillus sambharensis]
MEYMRRMAEEKIREAIERGELKNLPGEGKPLKLDDLSHVPEELRSGYIMLKNAGIVPEEVQLAKEMVTLQDMIRMGTSEAGKEELRRQLTEKQLRYRLLMEQRGFTDSGAFGQYKEQVKRQLEGESRDVSRDHND